MFWVFLLFSDAYILVNRCVLSHTHVHITCGSHLCGARPPSPQGSAGDPQPLPSFSQRPLVFTLGSHATLNPRFRKWWFLHPQLSYLTCWALPGLG